MSSRLLVISLATLGLCACSTVHKNIGQEDPGFGETVKYNAALETINPAPVYGPNGAQPGGNGDNGAVVGEATVRPATRTAMIGDRGMVDTFA